MRREQADCHVDIAAIDPDTGKRDEPQRDRDVNAGIDQDKDQQDRGDPDFDAIDRPQAAELPAVRWKLINVNKLKADNPKKHAAQGEELEKLLG